MPIHNLVLTIPSSVFSSSIVLSVAIVQPSLHNYFHAHPHSHLRRQPSGLQSRLDILHSRLVFSTYTPTASIPVTSSLLSAEAPLAVCPLTISSSVFSSSTTPSCGCPVCSTQLLPCLIHTLIDGDFLRGLTANHFLIIIQPAPHPNP